MKSQTREQMVKEFHEKFGLDVGTTPDRWLLNLRDRLITEEYKEVMEEFQLIRTKMVMGEAVTTEDWSKLLKEMADLQYVLSGTLVALNPLSKVDFDAVFNRVHKSNMSKTGGKDEGGKLSKGDDYVPPHIADLVEKL